MYAASNNNDDSHKRTEDNMNHVSATEEFICSIVCYAFRCTYFIAEAINKVI